MYVFYQNLVKEASSMRSPVCLSDDDEFNKVSGVVYLSQIHSMMFSDFIRVLSYDDLLVIYC